MTSGMFHGSDAPVSPAYAAHERLSGVRLDFAGFVKSPSAV